MNEKPRATDTEAVAALIWMSFVVNADVPPLDDDGKAYVSFKRALELYADTVEREKDDEKKLAEQWRSEFWGTPTRNWFYRPSAPMPPAPAPESDTAPEPDHLPDAAKMTEPEPEPPAAQPPDTHTHTHTGGQRPQK